MADERGNGNGAGRSKVRVLEIIGNAIVGGMEQYVSNLVRRLPPGQFQITCLCPYESAFTVHLRRLGCDVFISPLRDDPPWCSVQAAVEIIRRYDIDLIHAHLLNAHTLAGIAGSLTRRPALATIHTLSLPTQELCVSRLAGTHLLVVCQETYMQALAAGVPAERITLIPNGVDTQLFTPSSSGADFRRGHGIPDDAPLVGFVARISREKGPDKFVRVAERVHERRPEAHFAIVGEGPMEDEIAQMVRLMKADAYIHLAGLRRDVWDVYPAFDLLVQTSRSEAMPLSILEAMACGLPVVAVAVGGVAELVEAGTTGLLLSPGDWPGVASPYPGDWEGVACALVDLLSRPERLKEMGRMGRRRVEESFDLRASVRLTAALFERLVSDRRQAADAWRPPSPPLVEDEHSRAQNGQNFARVDEAPTE